MAIDLKESHPFISWEKGAVEHSLLCQLEMRPVCTRWLLTKTLNHHPSSGSTCICQHHEAANNRSTTQCLVQTACCLCWISSHVYPRGKLSEILFMLYLTQADRTVLPSTATRASSGPPVLPVEECSRGILFRSVHSRRILVLPTIQGAAAYETTQGVGEWSVTESFRSESGKQRWLYCYCQDCRSDISALLYRRMVAQKPSLVSSRVFTVKSRILHLSTAMSSPSSGDWAVSC